MLVRERWFSSMAGEAVLSSFLDSAGEGVPRGANAAILLLFRDSHQTRRYFSASGFQPELGWADAFKIIIKKTGK